MKQYKLVNNVLGWLTFFVAAFVYCSTIEPTASFWDCPEFITTGYKLEVGHPPGAPFFMLTANLFSQFASDPSQVARMVNTMSALLSATTILFLFWSITHLARKLILKDWSEMTLGKLIAIQASGLVGALIYTFSDTFWFSAVEGEVYAYSSAFTAIVFWLILKGLEKEKPVIFCGDLNVAHKEIDLKNPKTNRKNAGFTDEEREKFSKVLESGFIDTFRYFYPDQEGIYSWWSYRFKAREKNAGWRIDYFCVSESLKDKLEDAKIHTEIFGSDHCPVELDIRL